MPLQWTVPEVGPLVPVWKRLTAVVDLPPCGYRVYHLAGGEVEAGDGPAACPVPDDRLGIRSLPAKDGTELLSSPIGLVVVEDTSDTWAHGVDSFRTVLGSPEIEPTRILEDGPVVRIVRQKGRWRNSLVVLDIVTRRRIDAVELRVAANWARNSSPH